MRRTSIMLLALLSAVSLLVLPGQSASAEDSLGVERLHAVVTGFTEPEPDPQNHSLGINRVAGESEFEGLVIAGELECADLDEVVVFNVEQAENETVRYRTDDDITDGYGEINPTEPANSFRVDNATAVRADGSLSTSVEVEIRILGGRFHRVFNYVDVDLRLDIRVVVGDEEVCETPGEPSEPESGHEIRITFLIVGPDPDTEGFSLVGVARTHELPEDRTSIARAVCDTVVGPDVTRVSEPTRGSTIPADTIPGGSTIPGGGSTIPHGRGDFHPCGSESG